MAARLAIGLLLLVQILPSPSAAAVAAAIDPPCRAASPSLGRLAKRLTGEPFELVGVSNDSSREVLERYVAENEMDWTQVWDQYGEVGRNAFLVRSYPTYLILDHEGRVVYRASGWGETTRRNLEREIGSAVRKARKAVRDGG